MESEIGSSNQFQEKEEDNTISKKEDNTVIPLRSVLLFLAATLTTAVVLELLPIGCNFWSSTSFVLKTNLSTSAIAEIRAPTFAIFGKSNTEDHLLHVLKVLQRFGYQRKELSEDWDLLWAHDYPFLQMPKRLKSLQPHQMVNHFPGCGFITNKVDLSTTPLPFLPPAFRLPQEREHFLQYATDHPDALFVEKHNEHRYINIRAPLDVNLNTNDSFVQEFVKNPFLVDGYKFDIGVYVVITSVDPLRVYIYTGDVLFRFCTVKYYPFDASNVEKYVVGDDYLPIWEVPSLIKYYKRFGGSMRSTFDAYVRDQSLDPLLVWQQVEDIIRQTILTKERDLARILRSYRSRNFFDILRFDLIIDDQMRVHLMEANMSPNLSSAHYQPNSLLYEQILYNALNLVGIGSPVSRISLKPSSDDIEAMITSEKNLATNLNSCAAYDCDKSCNMSECTLCLPCLSGGEYEMLEKAHREHLHRAEMKRIFPKPILNIEKVDIENEVLNMTKKNELMTRWFYGKCQYDHSWCQ